MPCSGQVGCTAVLFKSCISNKIVSYSKFRSLAKIDFSDFSISSLFCIKRISFFLFMVLDVLEIGVRLIRSTIRVCLFREAVIRNNIKARFRHSLGARMIKADDIRRCVAGKGVRQDRFESALRAACWTG